MAHPDRHGGTKEAHEHFLRVQEAGELLADPFTRHISLQRRRTKPRRTASSSCATTPPPDASATPTPRRTARTGWMLVEGAPLLGDRQFMVSKIVQFESIEDDYDRVLTAWSSSGASAPPPRTGSSRRGASLYEGGVTNRSGFSPGACAGSYYLLQ